MNPWLHNPAAFARAAIAVQATAAEGAAADPRGLFVRCRMGFNSGPPMKPQSYNQNVQIFQTPEHVVLLNEMVHSARVVPLGDHPELAGDTLTYEFTMNDPAWYSVPWTARLPMARSDQPLYEFACHEGNYGLENILAGARRAEQLPAQSR